MSRIDLILLAAYLVGIVCVGHYHRLALITISFMLIAGVILYFTWFKVLRRFDIPDRVSGDEPECEHSKRHPWSP